MRGTRVMEGVSLGVAAGSAREGGQEAVEGGVVVAVVAEGLGCRLDMAALREDEHATGCDTTWKRNVLLALRRVLLRLKVRRIG